MLNNEAKGAGDLANKGKTESALCEKTLQELKELGSEVGGSFLTQLFETFAQDAVQHLAALQSAIAAGKTEMLLREAHALRGASLTIGAKSMAALCQHLESLGKAQSVEGAAEVLARLQREFKRVENEIAQETLTP
jgi:HPt (histidine-containing phosphotransfer) domain-containing protein